MSFKIEEVLIKKNKNVSFANPLVTQTYTMLSKSDYDRGIDKTDIYILFKIKKFI